MARLQFQDQLRRSFLGYMCVIIATVLVCFLVAFTLNFAWAVVGGSRESSQLLTDCFEEQYQAYTLGVRTLARGPELSAALLRDNAKDRGEANSALYQFSNGQGYKSYFVLLDQAGEVVCSNFNRRNQDSFAASAFAESACSRMDKAPEETLYVVCTAPITREQACRYSFCQAVLGPDRSPVGYLFFNLREESFRDSARAVPQKVLITDRYDNVIYTTLDLLEDPMDKLPSGKYVLDVQEDGIFKLDGEYHYVTVRTVTGQGLRFFTIRSLALEVRTLGYSLSLFLLLFVILAFFVSKMTRAFARQNAREIGELTRAVEELDRGSADYELSDQCSQESQQLYSQFRGMTLHLRELVRHNNELMDRRRQMEVKQLEEQFNPHFVYNVMETVRYQIGEDPEAASNMLLAFASLMRYSINYGHTKVSLETDVEYVNDYLLLQKVRYNNCLRYEFRIPDQLLDCRVPKLLLQPLIENSIKHGYCPGRVLEIVIEAQQVGQDLCFTVRDNGCGIAPDRLSAIRESFSMELNDPVITHIGLYNVQKVLELLYGPGYGIQIESVQGEGTTVRLTMPCETEEEEPC